MSANANVIEVDLASVRFAKDENGRMIGIRNEAIDLAPDETMMNDDDMRIQDAVNHNSMDRKLSKMMDEANERGPRGHTTLTSTLDLRLANRTSRRT